MQGAIVRLTSTQLAQNSYYSARWKYLTFDAVADFDSDGIYDTLNRDRLVVPASLDNKWAIVKISVRWVSGGQGRWVQILPTHFVAATNQDQLSGYPSCDPDNRPYVGNTTTDHSSETHPILLRTGDYFRAAAWQQQATGAEYDLGVLSGTFSLRVL